MDDFYAAFTYNFYETIMIAYIGMCAMGFIFGMGNGFNNWFHWFERRPTISLSTESEYLNNLIDPIVNVSRDMGYLAWHTVTSGILSGFIVATFPISVPLLACMSEDQIKSSSGRSKRRY